MAAQAVDAAQRMLRQPITPASTAELALPGGDLGALDAELAADRQATRDAGVADRLVLAYGSAWREVWHRADRDEALARRIDPGLPYVMAEVAHAVEREMACTLADVLVRRTHIAYETRDAGRAAARVIAPTMASSLGWTETETRAAVEGYEREAGRIFGEVSRRDR
jgi:glycerol-3-phosphate dehydrogenase